MEGRGELLTAPSNDSQSNQDDSQKARISGCYVVEL